MNSSAFPKVVTKPTSQRYYCHTCKQEIKNEVPFCFLPNNTKLDAIEKDIGFLDIEKVNSLSQLDFGNRVVFNNTKKSLLSRLLDCILP